MRQENNYLETLTDRTELFLSSVFGLRAANKKIKNPFVFYYQAG